MKRLQRPAAPSRFDRADAEASERLRQGYRESPQDHWNDEVRGAQPVREALKAMSGDRCAWCEAALGSGLEVEHDLPKTAFPLLRYCWENLLPACRECNGSKRAWHPEPLAGKALIDPVLAKTHTGDCYDPTLLLAKVEDRLVEPVIYEPEKHLTFQPECCEWKARSAIGRRTIARLFSDKSRNERMQRLSELAFGFASDGTSDETIEKYLGMHGYETTFRALLAYWRTFFPPRKPETSPASSTSPGDHGVS